MGRRCDLESCRSAAGGIPFHLVTLKADDKIVGCAIAYQCDPVAGVETIDWLDIPSRNTLLEGGNEIVAHTCICDGRFAKDLPPMKSAGLGCRSIGI